MKNFKVLNNNIRGQYVGKCSIFNMDSICDYCKASLEGIDFYSKNRPKGNFNDLLTQHCGSIRAVRDILTHENNSRCTCDELQLQIQCSSKQKKNQTQFELDSTIQQILTAYKNQDCNKDNIVSLLRNTISVSDVDHCRDKLWKLCNIDLSHCQLSCLPTSFGEILVEVRRLNLGFNCFKEVPVTLAKCLHLEYFNLSNNHLRYIPSWLSKNKSLKYLEVNNNYLMSLVLQEREIKKQFISNDASNWIESMDKERNRIVYFNKVSGEVSIRSKSGSEPLNRKISDDSHTLRHLHKLIISNNRLVSLPKRISDMSLLTELRISNNDLTSLPPELGNLINLQVFDVRNNKLRDINLDLRNCKSLEEMNFSSNNINTFPRCILEMENLRSLNISCNNIKQVPYRLGFHENLTILEICRNPLIDPPYEIFTQDTEKILWECRQLFWTLHHGAMPQIHVHQSGINGECLELEPDFDSTIKHKIEAAAKSSTLHLENLNLSHIPELIYDHPNITEISLHRNPLSNFDLKCSLTVLVSLNLRDCGLKQILSSSMKLLPNLEYLDLEENYLTKLPDSMTKLQKLKTLILDKNQLVTLPKNIGDMLNLVNLHLNYNSLREIPGCISLIKGLTVLCASHNELKEIPLSISEIKNLKVLNLRHNKLVNLPTLGILKLTHLFLSQNEIEWLDPEFFLPNMKKSMTHLELNGNNLSELPYSFPQCEKVILDMNPLISPPLDLVNEGIDTIVNYCYTRKERISHLLKGLKTVGFETSQRRFSPPATNVISQTGLLRPNDLKIFDQIIDSSVNGLFFHKSYCAKKIIQDISNLKIKREKETHKKILDCIINQLNSMIHSGMMLRGDIKKSFNVLENQVSCYAIPLQYVLLSDNNSFTIFNKVKSSLSELDSIFSFDNTMLSESFKFISPFGPVVSIEKIQYMVDNQLSEHFLSLVIAKHIYSDQEAASKKEEQDTLFTYFKKMERLVDDWALTKQGLRSINVEVSQRSKNINKAFNDCKKQLHNFRSLSADKLKIMQRRLNDYNENQPYDFHFIADDRAAEKLQSTFDMTKKEIANEVSLLEQKYLNAKLQKENKKRITLRNEALNDIKTKYCHKIYQVVYKNGRAYAMNHKQSRPWDQDGFIEFKEKKLEKKESILFLNNEDLLNRLDLLLQSTSFVWTYLENMEKYEDNLPYKKFKSSTSFLEHFNQT